MPPDTATRLALRDLALTAARRGGAAAMARFRSHDLAVDIKDDDSPVTLADQEAEATIRACIDAARPEDGWLGEETGSEPGSTGLEWIVDPIDGTRNFVRGVPLWATLVACEATTPSGKQVVASAVGFPALMSGMTQHLSLVPAVATNESQSQPLINWVSRCGASKPRIGSSIMALGVCSMIWLPVHCNWQRGLCDAYGHALVASGRAEVVVEPTLSTWDVAATQLAG